MKIYAKKVDNRRVLIDRLVKLTGVKANYTRMPRCAYEIGMFTVERDGTLSVSDYARESDKVVINVLMREGLIGDEITSENDDVNIELPEAAEIPEETDSQEESENSTIPYDEITSETAEVQNPEIEETEQNSDAEVPEEPIAEMSEENEVEISEDNEVSQEENENPDTFLTNLSVSFPLAGHTVHSITNLVCMMNDRIDMVITKSISRFARNTLDCLTYIRQLKAKNIPVFFEKENINTLDARGEVCLTIMASLAQQESQSLSQNVRLGLQYRYQQGKVQVCTSRFLGYDKDKDGNLVINPKEAEIVKRIYQEYLDGKSYCAHCGDIYQRTHWLISGKDVIVWRCTSRLRKKTSGIECPARTIRETELHAAVVKAVNQVMERKDKLLSNERARLEKEKKVAGSQVEQMRKLDDELEDLQRQLLKKANAKQGIDELVDKINAVREAKQKILLETATTTGTLQQIDELESFLKENAAGVKEYDESLVRKLIEKITVYDDHLHFEFKSGIQVDD